MASSLQDSLGQGHLVFGKITSSAGTAATLTSNDGSATMSRAAAGDYTVTFGDAFLTAPLVVANIVDATFATTATHTVVVKASATGSVQFNMATLTLTGATTSADSLALADGGDISFMAFGLRNN